MDLPKTSCTADFSLHFHMQRWKTCMGLISSYIVWIQVFGEIPYIFPLVTCFYNESGFPYLGSTFFHCLLLHRGDESANLVFFFFSFFYEGYISFMLRWLVIFHFTELKLKPPHSWTTKMHYLYLQIIELVEISPLTEQKLQVKCFKSLPISKETNCTGLSSLVGFLQAEADCYS